jgi:tetratricopeptide (TPR) repeat protein
MKKKILLVLPVILIFGSGFYLWFSQKRPPLETKFVQEVKDQGAENKEQEEKYNNNEVPSDDPNVKMSGSRALVELPTHTYQTFNNCGPATLSMILAFNGKDVSQKKLGDEMRPYQIPSGDNDDKTIFTYEFTNWAKEYGMNAISRVNGNIETLKKFTANGIPVVAKTWLHVGEDIGHFRIVTGFDDEREVVIQDDSYEGPNKKINYYDFLSMWQPFNYAYIVVYPSDKSDLVETIIAEEFNETTAWENSLKRAQKEGELDSENVYPVFNQSVAYYRLGNYQASVDAFEKVEGKLPRRMLWYQIEPILAYQKLGEYDRVFGIIDNILNNGNRAFSELYQIKGEIYFDQGEVDAARNEFEKALQYNENYQPAKDGLNSL